MHSVITCMQCLINFAAFRLGAKANAAVSQWRRDSHVGEEENGSLKYAIAKVFVSILSE